MRVKIQKLGKSLVVRIPKALARQMELNPNTPVEIVWQGDKIIITPRSEPELILDDLLAGITNENLHGEVDLGYAVGNESCDKR
jgi:antitoxin MazE